MAGREREIESVKDLSEVRVVFESERERGRAMPTTLNRKSESLKKR